jgi:pimeloyl-ACP methyl ester carboxylesterase
MSRTRQQHCWARRAHPIRRRTWRSCNAGKLGRMLVASVVLAAAIGVTACGGGGSSSQQSSGSKNPNVLEGSFDVGGHKLYMRCEGSGSPTVVYFHGYSNDARGGGSRNAGRIPGLLSKGNRVCVYDRANVGRSDKVPGPLTGKSSVEDLHGLLAVANVRPPYVLLGASFGGLIANMYAASFPDDIAGLVLLDPALPGGDSLIDSFLPQRQRLHADDWRNAFERIDLIVTDRQSKALASKEPQVPLTLIAIKQPNVDPAWKAKKRIAAALRRQQRRFVARFVGGRLVTLDVPHYMEPVIPERIAKETQRMIARIP